ATQTLAEQEQRHAELKQAWAREKEVVDEILALRAKLRAVGVSADGAASAAGQVDATAGDADAAVKTDAAQAEASNAAPTLSAEEREQAIARLRELQQQLSQLQGDRPLILPSVDEQAVGSVVAD